MKHITRDFVLAGDAIFTIECPDGKWYTYRVQKAEATSQWPTSWFVKLLTGPSNTSDYTYVGRLNDYTSETRVTAKSKYTAESFPVVLLNRTLARVWSDDHDAYEKHGYKTRHEGRCCVCARLLTTPDSIEHGIGPVCAGKA